MLQLVPKDGKFKRQKRLVHLRRCTHCNEDSPVNNYCTQARGKALVCKSCEKLIFKPCSICHTSKPISDYFNCNTRITSDGKYEHCKVCSNNFKK